MSKTSRNYGAFLAVLFLALLVTGLVFVIKVAYVDEPKLTESMTVEATDGSVPTSTETEAPKDTRIAVFETSDINGYLVDTSSGNPNTFE